MQLDAELKSKRHHECPFDPLLFAACYHHAISNLSRFITLFQAATKSFTNFSFASAAPYTSAIALSSELEPNTRSARVANHFTLPVVRSLPSYSSLSSVAAFQAVFMSSRFTKKSL